VILDQWLWLGLALLVLGLLLWLFQIGRRG
jgi:hypothetical protein